MSLDESLPLTTNSYYEGYSHQDSINHGHDDHILAKMMNKTIVSQMVLQHILSKQRTIVVEEDDEDNDDKSDNRKRRKYSFVPPCLKMTAELLSSSSSLPTAAEVGRGCSSNSTNDQKTLVIESLSSLLVASAISKADNNVTSYGQHDNNNIHLWQFFDAIWKTPRRPSSLYSSSPTAASSSSSDPAKRADYPTFFLPKFIFPIELSSMDGGLTPPRSYGNSSSDYVADAYPYYIPNTRVPNWPLFHSLSFGGTNGEDQDDDTPSDMDKVIKSICGNVDGNKNHTSYCWIGSGRISSAPFHATYLLKLISQLEYKKNDGSDSRSDSGSNDDENNNSTDANTRDNDKLDMPRILEYFDSIYRYHEYLHDVVMRGCHYSYKDDDEDGDGGNQQDENGTKVPCYNIVHPWESLQMDMKSPMWQVALEPTLQRINDTDWKLFGQDAPFTTTPTLPPPQVEESYDYDPSTYTAMMYLSQCITNQTTLMHKGPKTADGRQHREYRYFPYDGTGIDLGKTGLKDIEDRIIQECPFAMLDVGYAAVLAQADADLLKIAQWLLSDSSSTSSLSSSTSSSQPSWSTRLTRLIQWKQQSEYVVDRLLWDGDSQSYLSRYAIPPPTSPSVIRSMNGEAVEDAVTSQLVSNNDPNGTDVHTFPTMEFCAVPVSSNLMPFWMRNDFWQDDDYMYEYYYRLPRRQRRREQQQRKQQRNEQEMRHKSRVQKMAIQLLRHSGRYSFDCGDYPIWSRGCEWDNESGDFSTIASSTKDNDLVSAIHPTIFASTNKTASTYMEALVDPKLNFFIGTGLNHNQANVAAFGKYLRDATIHIICDKRGKGHLLDEGEHTCANHTTWLQEAYEVVLNSMDIDFNMDECGSSNTATGSILFHLLIPDHEFVPLKPIPPIGNSWVITLITAELMVAFTVGATCICLSLGLVRRENRNTSGETANSGAPLQRRDEARFNNNSSSNGSYYSAMTSSFDFDENQHVSLLPSSPSRSAKTGQVVEELN